METYNGDEMNIDDINIYIYNIKDLKEKKFLKMESRWFTMLGQLREKRTQKRKKLINEYYYIFMI